MKIIKYFIFFTFIIFISNCGQRIYGFRQIYKEANHMIHDSKNLKERPFLKAHLKDGSVVLFQDKWKIDSITNEVSGFSKMYDFNRKKLSEGNNTVKIENVALFESNIKVENGNSERVTAMILLTGLDVFLATICLTQHKACFGSCPTFYTGEGDYAFHADAEGFSNAIAPSLEYADVDALNNEKITTRAYSIKMKNEALETHVVNEVKLLAVPRNSNERIFQSRNNEFYKVDHKMIEPVYAQSDEGNITEQLRYSDHKERFSKADPTNMSSKENIIVEFDNEAFSEQAGLVINFRQTLMTTYLIYNAISYMGDEVGDIFAKIETNKKLNNKLKDFYHELGEIEVFVMDQGQWIYQGGLYETGPIAFNKQIIPLKPLHDKKKIKIKLVLNKGLWRIDEVGLARIKSIVNPSTISPGSILKNNVKYDAAIASIDDDQKSIVSMPGDEFTFNFTMPLSNQDYELFLMSKGYYLEWMRSHWLKDKNLSLLRKMITQPKKYLKDEAANYKKYEEVMEEQFWSSKINTKINKDEN